MSKYLRALAASVIGAFAVIEFTFIRDGFSALNATVYYFSLLLAFFVAVGFPPRETRNRMLQFTLMGAIVALSACFTLFDNRGLDFLNKAVILFLMGILCLQRIGEGRVAIGEKGFLKELFLGFVLRPILCIPDPFKEATELRKVRKNLADGTTDTSPTRGNSLSVILQIIIALAVGLPLVLILTVLLASSDAVFADWLGDLFKLLDERFVADILLRLFLFVPVAPFVASIIFSYKNKRFYSGNGGASAESKPLLIPAIPAITILALVNALYLVFAIVQSVYMFGAWAGELPDGLTYAEYARSGFFELAFVSAINAIMILVSIRYTNRSAGTGMVVRIFAMLLIVLSFVQLASAFRRMALYIEAYGLSEDRYLVSGFMILMGALFIMLAVREFVEKLPLFKSALLAGILALLLINFSVPGYRVASHNIDRYLSGDLDRLDAKYLMTNSSDSLLVLLEREDDLRDEDDDKLDEDLDRIDEYVSSRYIWETEEDNWVSTNFFSSYYVMNASNWKSFNVSSFRVLLETSK